MSSIGSISLMGPMRLAGTYPAAGQFDSCATFLRQRSFLGAMKKHILTVAAAALLAIPTFLSAQDKPAPDKPAPGGERPGRGGPGGPGGRAGAFTAEAQLKRLTEQLTLTQEQQD